MKIFKMQFIFYFIITLLIVGNSCASNTLEVVIAHNGAVYGNIFSSAENQDGEIKYKGGAVLLSTQIKKLRDETSANNGLFLFLNSGSLWHGSNEAELTKGKSIVEVYNQIGLDAMTIGNREFGFGYDVFKQRTSQAKFDILSANIASKSKKFPRNIKSFIIKEIQGIKIGIIGLTNPDLIDRVNPNAVKDFNFTDYAAAAHKTVKKLKKKGVQFVVILSHLLPDKDKILAKKVKDIDLIIGRAVEPSMTKEYKLSELNKIPYALVNPKGYDLGVFKLKFNKNTKKFISHDWKVIKLNSDNTKPDKEIIKLVQKYAVRYDKLANKKLGKSNTNFYVDWKDIRRERLLGNLITDIIKKELKVDFALINTGSVRDLNKGVIKLKDLFNAIPFEDNLVSVKMTGEFLLKIIKKGLVSDKKGGWQVSRNVNLVYNSNKKKGSILKSIRIDNKPIINSKLYFVGTTGYISDLYNEFKKGKNFKTASLSIRDLFKNHIEKNSPISAKLEDRIKDTASKKK
jgi:2',3'-cyclic-nucleotide 2'-phosphodiesterase (5'-nucleotidase family)